MRKISLFSIVLILLCSGFEQTFGAQKWDKYIPEKQRKDTFKKCFKATGMGAAMTGQIGITMWVTESMARVLVSQSIDKERLTNEEAEAKYNQLRNKSGYTFLIDARRVATSPFGTRASSLNNPLAPNETFLQRKENKERFAKGEVGDHQFEINLGGLFRGGSLQSTYVVVFPSSDRSGEPIITSLADKIEIQFTLAGKKIVLEYKIKDLVTRLEDL